MGMSYLAVKITEAPWKARHTMCTDDMSVGYDAGKSV